MTKEELAKLCSESYKQGSLDTLEIIQMTITTIKENSESIGKQFIEDFIKKLENK